MVEVLTLCLNSWQWGASSPHTGQARAPQGAGPDHPLLSYFSVLGASAPSPTALCGVASAPSCPVLPRGITRAPPRPPSALSPHEPRGESRGEVDRGGRCRGQRSTGRTVPSRPASAPSAPRPQARRPL